MNPGVSCTPNVTHIVLPPNMDRSSFACHHTWQAGLSQMGAKTDTARLGKHNALLYKIVILLYYITVIKLSVSSLHTGLSETTPYTASFYCGTVVPTGLPN